MNKVGPNHLLLVSQAACMEGTVNLLIIAKLHVYRAVKLLQFSWCYNNHAGDVACVTAVFYVCVYIYNNWGCLGHFTNVQKKKKKISKVPVNPLNRANKIINNSLWCWSTSTREREYFYLILILWKSHAGILGHNRLFCSLSLINLFIYLFTKYIF